MGCEGPTRAVGLSFAVVHSQWKHLVVVAEACAQLLKPTTAKEKEEGGWRGGGAGEGGVFVLLVI